jgi:hypothetical protein
MDLVKHECLLYDSKVYIAPQLLSMNLKTWTV